MAKKREHGRDEHGEYEVVYPPIDPRWGTGSTRHGGLFELARRYGMKRRSSGEILVRLFTGREHIATPINRIIILIFGALGIITGVVLIYAMQTISGEERWPIVCFSTAFIIAGVVSVLNAVRSMERRG
jgi:hypothetical protein